MFVNIVRIEENWKRDRNVQNTNNFIYALAQNIGVIATTFTELITAQRH
jgi:hypothetical protein